MAQPAEVRNAADRDQVKGAGQRERRRAARRLAMYAAVLGTPEGRFVMWDLLCGTGLFESSFSQSALIYFNEGKRNVGLKLRADLEAADEDACALMEREARALAKRDAAETDAAHLSSASSQESTT